MYSLKVRPLKSVDVDGATLKLKLIWLLAFECMTLAGKNGEIDPPAPFESDPHAPLQIDPLKTEQIDPLFRV